MAYQTQDPLAQTYDAVVVGSGATGGWAAKQLAEAGLKVALLEAGRPVTPQEFTEHMPAYKLKYRDHSPEIARTRPVQKQCYACMEYNYEWFVNDLENPYSTPQDKPFTWQRLRVLGGARLAGAVKATASATSISRPTATMATARIGPSHTPTCRRSTTSSKITSASAAPRKTILRSPTATFCRQ